MADPFDASLRAVRRLRGIAATYRRGSLAVPVRVIRGKSEAEIGDGFGALTLHRFEDFIVERLTLIGDDGQPLNPLSGDLVEIVDDFGTTTYEVTEPDSNTPAATAATPTGSWLRIHTQKSNTP